MHLLFNSNTTILTYAKCIPMYDIVYIWNTICIVDLIVMQVEVNTLHLKPIMKTM